MNKTGHASQQSGSQ